MGKNLSGVEWSYAVEWKLCNKPEFFLYIDIYAKSILCIIHGCKSDLPDKLITLYYCYSEDHLKGQQLEWLIPCEILTHQLASYKTWRPHGNNQLSKFFTCLYKMVWPQIRLFQCLTLILTLTNTSSFDWLLLIIQ